MANKAQPAAAVSQQAKATQRQSASTIKNQNAAFHHTNANTPSPSNTAPASTLHSTMTRLNQAEHDYNGHRARAIHEISTAIRHLGTQAGQSNTGNTGPAHSGNANGTNTATRTATGTGTGTATGSGQKLPQAMSDAYLREAQQSLVSLESQMNTNGINSHSFTQAKSSVQNAIRELNLALIDR